MRIIPTHERVVCKPPRHMRFKRVTMRKKHYLGRPSIDCSPYAVYNALRSQSCPRNLNDLDRERDCPRYNASTVFSANEMQNKYLYFESPSKQTLNDMIEIDIRPTLRRPTEKQIHHGNTG